MATNSNRFCQQANNLHVPDPFHDMMWGTQLPFNEQPRTQVRVHSALSIRCLLEIQSFTALKHIREKEGWRSDRMGEVPWLTVSIHSLSSTWFDTGTLWVTVRHQNDNAECTTKYECVAVLLAPTIHTNLRFASPVLIWPYWPSCPDVRVQPRSKVLLPLQNDDEL